MSDHPDAPPRHEPTRRARLLLDRALSASAGVVALSALAVSVYQTIITRQQQRLGAWPYVTIQNAWAGQRTGYSIRAANNGVGPALVRSVEVRVDGIARRNWGEVASALIGHGTRATYTTFHRGSVLLPGVERSVVEFPVDSDAVAFYRAAQQPLRADPTRARLEILACYCSLYDDCWMDDSSQEEPRRVDACRPARTPWDN